MKISDSVEKIDGTMANVYAIRHDGKVVLIDSGMKMSAKNIIRFFNERSERPDAVMITHYHPDHIGGLARIVEQFNPRIYASSLEIGVIRGQEKLKPAASLTARMVGALGKSQAVEQVLPLEEIPFDWMKAIDTHGHTPGSTSYLFEPEKLLFVGDAVTVKGDETSVNRKFSLDVPEAERSREKILSMKGLTILPGHGDPLRIQ